MSISKINSPYPYFGSKRSVADVIWKAFGDISNYIEPFGGSMAVLLANPQISKIETVNDKDCFIANFWRAIAADVDTVIKYADLPVNETDLHARHRFLVSSSTDDFKLKMNSDPDYFDAKIAGWWVWGMGCSIGNNWLQPKGLNSMPMISSAGGGIHGLTYSVSDWLYKLKNRTRRVRVCCGDWSKLVTPSVTFGSKGIGKKDYTAILLDPPYLLANRSNVYLNESNIFNDVCNWAINNGNNQKLRIAVCGYKGDFIFPNDWTEYKWQTNGGLANKSLTNSQGISNKNKEVIYFSPHCLSI